MKFGEDLFNNELRPAHSDCYQPFSAEFHNGALREQAVPPTARSALRQKRSFPASYNLTFSHLLFARRA